MIVEIRGIDGNARMTVEFPDDLPDEDRKEITDKLQQIVNSCDSMEELAEKFEQVAAQLQLIVWRTH